jgi:hypothetical protein
MAAREIWVPHPVEVFFDGGSEAKGRLCAHLAQSFPVASRKMQAFPQDQQIGSNINQAISVDLS